MTPTLSIVVPAYNESGNLEKLASELEKNLADKNYEVIFVNDGSRDNTLELLRTLNQRDPRLHYLSFSKNCGHQYALRAGLQYARGEAVVMMDADLQHPPALIPEMLKRWQAGDKVVYTLRQDMQSGASLKKQWTSRLFYWLLGILSDVKLEPGAADFRLIDRKVLNVINSMPEHSFFIRGVIPWLGFQSSAIEYQPGERHSGQTQYTLKKMMQLAILGLTSFSTKPLTFSIYVGFLMSIVAFLYALYAVTAHFFFSSVVAGWTSIVASIMFVGGLQLVILGVIGHYIGHIFIEVKRRPSFIVEESSLI